MILRRVTVQHTYIYPDGTRSIRKPRDGELFSIWDHHTSTVIEWVYDGFVRSWIRKAGIGEKFTKENVRLACECGSEKCGSNRHSNWCPKYSDQNC